DPHPARLPPSRIREENVGGKARLSRSIPDLGSALLMRRSTLDDRVRPLALVTILLVVALAGCNFPLNNGGAVGSAAKGLVDPRKYAKLVVEIDYPQGYGPDADAIGAFKQTIEQVSGRSADDITIDEQAQIPVETGKKYTLSEIVALEDAHRDH